MKSSPGTTESQDPPPGRRATIVAGAAAVILFGASILFLHVLAVTTESINWDEFALFARAVDSVQGGKLITGGRPGLGVVSLIPIAVPCESEVATVQLGRFLWIGWTLLAGLALWLLVRRCLTGAKEAPWAAALAVGLWFLVPVVERWSLHVRTDQPALALALLGTLGLLDRRGRLFTGILSGALFGLGYLFSQKAVYVAALGMLLWMFDRFPGLRGLLASEWKRLVGIGAGGLAVLAAFRIATSLAFEIPDALTIDRALRFRADYSDMSASALIGAGATLVPHLVLVLLMLLATHRLWGSGSPEQTLLLRSWAVLALGGAVLLFHTSRFVYFWITLGIFPAVALALALPVIRHALPPGLVRITLATTILLLAIPGISAARSMLLDSQRFQRESLEFVDRNFSDSEAGFQPERALFCRDSDDPFPTYFTLRIGRDFRPAARGKAEEFLRKFRERPVYYIVDSHRLSLFPPAIWDFWRAHYVPYYSAVAIPGFTVDGAGPSPQTGEIIIPGDYRWIPLASSSGAALRLDGVDLPAREARHLEAGAHSVETGSGVSGVVAWALAEEPHDPQRSFYGLAMLNEFTYGNARGATRRRKVD
ncbi:MAG: hypothetical protein AB7G12_04485 [Thermoanaerobaculia bacterium]